MQYFPLDSFKLVCLMQFKCILSLYQFMKPLQMSTETSQPILTMADYKSMFLGIDELHILHRDFMDRLEPRVANWNDRQVIGDLFHLLVGLYLCSSLSTFIFYIHYIIEYKPPFTRNHPLSEACTFFKSAIVFTSQQRR